MIPLQECAAVLLCAGQSRRFGPSNKLLSSLGGRPLVTHAADLCAQLPFAFRIAVVPPDEPSLKALLSDRGFDLVTNPDPASGKESSLHLGLERAHQKGARAVIVLLGDMPLVIAEHLEALCSVADDRQAAISRSGDVQSPPTLIPAHFLKIAIENRDLLVRACLGSPSVVEAPAWLMTDYDYPEQFSFGVDSSVPVASVRRQQ